MTTESSPELRMDIEKLGSIYSVYVFLHIYLTGSLAFLGFIGNVLCGVIIYKDDQVNGVMRFLLKTMVIAHCAFLSVACLLNSLWDFIVNLRNPSDLMSGSSALRSALFVMTQVTVVYMMTLMTIVRYASICHPLKTKVWLTTTKVRVAVMLAVLLATCTSMPAIVAGVKALCGSPMEFRSEEHKGFQRGTMIVQLVLQWFLPVITFLVLNIKMIKQLRRSIKVTSQLTSRPTSRQDDVTKYIIGLTVVFTVCQTPLLIMTISFTKLLFTHDGEKVMGITTSFSSTLSAYIVIECISNVLWVLNSTANFILYFAYSRRFRKLLVKSLSKCRIWKQGGFNVESASQMILPATSSSSLVSSSVFTSNSSAIILRSYTTSSSD